MPYVIGLTGGIGSGKSTVSKLFASLGIPTIDTDTIARQVVEPKSLTLQACTQVFGEDVLTADGHLDRAKLRAIVFQDAEALKTLEGILHPAIREETKKQIQESQAPYCLVAIPLLFEKGDEIDYVNESLLVCCSQAQQVERTMTRDNCSQAQVLAILNKQMPQDKKRVLADHIIENTGKLAQLDEQVQKLHRVFLQNLEKPAL